MTITFKIITIDKYIISINQDKYETTYKVIFCEEIQKGSAYARELKRNTYGTYEEAVKRCNYLKRKIEREGIA